jgi:glycosyltransferase involved in cell wall biosynthesis
MRILALSNFYPPNHIGGEELSAKAIVDGLREKGHVIDVLTSNYGIGPKEPHIHREFNLEMQFQPLIGAIRFFFKRREIIQRNNKKLIEFIKDLQPDLILVFSMWNIPREVPALAETLLGDRVVYRLASYWPLLPNQHVEYWNAPARSWLTGIIKRPLKKIALLTLKKDPDPQLQLKHTICISEAVQMEYARKGVSLPNNRVIYNGIKISQFINHEPDWSNNLKKPKKILYVGRISPEKGVETAIEAMALLQHQYPDITLSLFGATNKGAELKKLHTLVDNFSLSEKVLFLGPAPYKDIPGIMHDHQILVVPSIWPEPFGRVVLEGMASGMVVIGTGQGGMGVPLKNKVTGLTFPPRDAEKLSEQIALILENPTIGNTLSKTARQMVVSRFSEKMMVDAYEDHLFSIFSRYAYHPSGQLERAN